MDVESKELEGCKYTFACPRRLVVMSDLFPDGKEGDKTRGTEPSEKETTEMENTKHTGRTNSTAQYQPLRIQGEQIELCTVSTVTYTERANRTLHSINRYVYRAIKQHSAHYQPLRIHGEQTALHSINRYVYRTSKHNSAQYQPLRIQGEQTALCTVSTVTYTGRANSTLHNVNRYIHKASKQYFVHINRSDKQHPAGMKWCFPRFY